MRWSSSAAELTKALFGRSLRVVLAAWILELDRPFFLQEAQQAMQPYGEASSGVAQELRKFVGYQMLSEIPDARRIYFTMLPSPLWEAYRSIITAIAAVVADERSAERASQV